MRKQFKLKLPENFMFLSQAVRVGGKGQGITVVLPGDLRVLLKCKFQFSLVGSESLHF